MVNVPFFDEKNESQLVVTAGTGGSELQLTQAFSEHFYGIFDFVYDVSKARNIDTAFHVKDGNNDFQNKLGEIGFGYFTKFGVDKEKIFAISAGGGVGNLQSVNNAWTFPETVSVNARYHKIFVMPSIGKKQNGYEYAFASRLSLPNYYKVTDMILNVDHYSKAWDVILEPCFVARTGTDQFKMVAQLGYTIPLKRTIKYDYSSFVIAVGFHLNFTKARLDRRPSPEETEDIYGD